MSLRAEINGQSTRMEHEEDEKQDFYSRSLAFIHGLGGQNFFKKVS